MRPKIKLNVPATPGNQLYFLSLKPQQAIQPAIGHNKATKLHLTTAESHPAPDEEGAVILY